MKQTQKSQKHHEGSTRHTQGDIEQGGEDYSKREARQGGEDYSKM